MKICFLMVSHSSSIIGGAEIQVDYIIDHLIKNTSHEIYYVCKKTKLTEHNRVEIFQIKTNRFLSKYLNCVDFISISKILEKIKPDIIYTRTSTAYVGIAAHYSEKNNVKLIYHIAHIEDVEPLKINKVSQCLEVIERKVYLYGLKRANFIIAQAKYQNILLEKNYKWKCHAIIPNFHSHPIEKCEKNRPIKIVWIANIKPSKQPRLFIDLAKEFEFYKDVEFAMVGAITSREFSEILVEAKSLNNFKYLGQKSLIEVEKILSGAHIFVNTSLKGEEGFPNTFIQAWMRKVPVLSLNIDPDDIIKKFGLGKHSKTFVDLVNDLRELIEENEFRIAIGERASVFAKEHFGLKNIKDIINIMES